MQSIDNVEWANFPMSCWNHTHFVGRGYNKRIDTIIIHTEHSIWLQNIPPTIPSCLHTHNEVSRKYGSSFLVSIFLLNTDILYTHLLMTADYQAIETHVTPNDLRTFSTRFALLFGSHSLVVWFHVSPSFLGISEQIFWAVALILFLISFCLGFRNDWLL